MADDKVRDVEFGKRLVQLREEKRLSRAAAAKKMTIGLSALQQYESGILPGPKNTEKLRSFYKCNKAWLLSGEESPFQPVDKRGLWNEPLPPEMPDEFVLIPQVHGTISAGGGLVPDNSVDLRVAFRRDWISRKGRPQNMSMIKVQGDSMVPTLLDGDLVLVNHSRTTVAPQGGIYAVSINNEIMIKRIQPIFPDKLLVISDNKQYSPYEIFVDNVRVNGKIIWYARDLER